MPHTKDTNMMLEHLLSHWKDIDELTEVKTVSSIDELKNLFNVKHVFVNTRHSFPIYSIPCKSHGHQNVAYQCLTKNDKGEVFGCGKIVIGHPKYIVHPISSHDNRVKEVIEQCVSCSHILRKNGYTH